MDWLQYDEVELAALPDWAQSAAESRDGKPYDVRICQDGLALLRGRRASALRWEDVLVPIRLEDPRRLLIAAARKPPRTPWFEVGGADVDAIERALRARLEAVGHRGYRQRRRHVARIPPEQVLASVLAREPLPGAVEIPAATPSISRSSAIGASVGGMTLGFYGLAFGPVGMAIAAGVGALGGGMLMAGVEYARKRAAGRVLVLTPDAFVAGLDGQQVRAVPWQQVGRFAAGIDLVGIDALEVFGHDRQVIARVAARFFGAPLDVIVAVAEAYRQRASDMNA